MPRRIVLSLAVAIAALLLGLVLAIGLTYPLLEGIVCWLIIRCRLPRSKAPSDRRRAPRQRTPLSQ